MNDLRRFYVNTNYEDIKDNKIVLKGSEYSHFKVLRPSLGTLVELVNGEGGLLSCEVSSIGAYHANLKIINKVLHNPPSSICVMAIAISRIKKFEEIIEPLSEIGCDYIFPFISERCVLKNPNKIDILERWRLKAISALKQSRRTHLMKMGNIENFNELLLEIKKQDHVFLAQPERKKTSDILDVVSQQKFKSEKVMGIVGPEGGFTEDESAAIVDNGGKTVSLGENILRINTAVITMAFVLCLASKK